MDPFIAVAAVLMLAIIPVLFLAWRGEIMDTVIALQATGVLVSMTLMAIAEGMRRSALFDPALVTAFLAIGGGLVIVRWLEEEP